MNQFKHLDSIFPTGTARLSGEVVSVSVGVFFPSFAREQLFTISGKRKAWYVNASVNAFHLHRHLCRELRLGCLLAEIELDARSYRTATGLLAIFVKDAYARNHASNTQYHHFQLEFVPSEVRSRRESSSDPRSVGSSGWIWEIPGSSSPVGASESESRLGR